MAPIPMNPKVDKDTIELLLELVRVLASDDTKLQGELTTLLEWHLENRYQEEEIVEEVISEG